MPNYTNLHFLFSSNYASSIEIVRKINEMQEKRRRLNTDVNLPPNLITRKIHEYNTIERDGYRNMVTVEILCASYIALEKQITLNSIKKFLSANGFNGNLNKKILRYVL